MSFDLLFILCANNQNKQKMEQITKIVQEISSFLWGWPMIVLLLGTHLYLTVRLRFPQLHILKALRLSVSKDREPAAT